MYTMMQVCREADMTYQTLKFYCNEGLIPNVKRDLNNRRVFDERDVRWIKDLVCLKRCGMSIQEMREYLDLCLEGEGTIPRRKEVLAKKQAALRAQIKELQDSIDYIDFKQQFYDEVLSGKRKYVSNLIKVEDGAVYKLFNSALSAFYAGVLAWGQFRTRRDCSYGYTLDAGSPYGAGRR